MSNNLLFGCKFFAYQEWAVLGYYLHSILKINFMQNIICSVLTKVGKQVITKKEWI